MVAAEKFCISNFHSFANSADFLQVNFLLTIEGLRTCCQPALILIGLRFPDVTITPPWIKASDIFSFHWSFYCEYWKRIIWMWKTKKWLWKLSHVGSKLIILDFTKFLTSFELSAWSSFLLTLFWASNLGSLVIYFSSYFNHVII